MLTNCEWSSPTVSIRPAAFRNSAVDFIAGAMEPPSQVSDHCSASGTKVKPSRIAGICVASAPVSDAMVRAASPAE